MLSEASKARFWSRVQKADDGCWNWTGKLFENGYGRFDQYRAHRVAFQLTNGFVPELLRHTCDNRQCVNPKHLLPGTHQDNVQDRVDRGRSAKGKFHGRSKLNECDVAIARNAHDCGVSATTLAHTFGVSVSTMARAIRGKTWRSVS